MLICHTLFRFGRSLEEFRRARPLEFDSWLDQAADTLAGSVEGGSELPQSPCLGFTSDSDERFWLTVERCWRLDPDRLLARLDGWTKELTAAACNCWMANDELDIRAMKN